MNPDWIQSHWIRDNCTIADPSYNQFRETLNLLHNEHELEQGRNLALFAANLIRLAKKVEHYRFPFHILSPIYDPVAVVTSYHTAFTKKCSHFIMDPRIKYYCKRCNFPTDHGIIKKLDNIFTKLEMDPHEGELHSLITNVVHQVILTGATRDQKVPAHIRF